MSQTSRAGSIPRLVGNILIATAIVVAVINNDTYRWAIGIPIVLAILGMGLRIEAALLTSRSG